MAVHCAVKRGNFQKMFQAKPTFRNSTVDVPELIFFHHQTDLPRSTNRCSNMMSKSGASVIDFPARQNRLRHLKGLSHDMDLAFEDMHGQF